MYQMVEQAKKVKKLTTNCTNNIGKMRDKTFEFVFTKLTLTD